MKPYFAKYLPGEGPIEVGSKIRSESSSRHVVTVTSIENDIYWTDECDFQDPTGISYFGVRKNKAQKVGVFSLCRRDVKLGDKVKFKDISVEVDIPIDEKNWNWLSQHAPWSVIGEISLEAVWVKEGDEFSEEEVKEQWRRAQSMYVELFPIGESPDPRSKKKSTGLICIKCPTCKKFH